MTDEYTEVFNSCLMLLKRSAVTIQTEQYITDGDYYVRIWNDCIMETVQKIGNQSSFAAKLAMATLDEIEELDRERMKFKVC